MKYYGLFGSIMAQPGKRDELLNLLLEAAKLLQQNNDCLHYLVGKSTDQNGVWVSETWTSKEAHDASVESAAVRALIDKTQPLIAATPLGTEWDVLGGKGL